VLFDEEHVCIYLGDCRRSIGSIVEYRDFSNDGASRVHVHDLFPALCVLLKDPDFTAHDYKKPCRGFSGKKQHFPSPEMQFHCSSRNRQELLRRELSKQHCPLKGRDSLGIHRAPANIPRPYDPSHSIPLRHGGNLSPKTILRTERWHFGMKRLNLNALIEYNDKNFFPKILINRPAYCVVLLSMRKGQSVPEHSIDGSLTVQAILGHVTVYEGSFPCELHSGEIVCIESGVPHRLEAQQDSAVLVSLVGKRGSPRDEPSVLDLRNVPQPSRHSLVFASFDALATGESLGLINDRDPVHLNRQFEITRPGESSWEYLEDGPEIFRIRIQRVADCLSQSQSSRALPGTTSPYAETIVRGES
jgi:uncharacterized protein (DUF2249 family)/quercetin dioxygenase-like cupin family protein